MSEGSEKSAGSFRTSIRVLGFLLIALLPVFLLALGEFALRVLHDHVAPRRFENEREALTRNSIMPAKFLGDPKQFLKELKSAKTKVAVFGESSAAGYASPLGFADFLEKALPERLVVHNFAEPGAPFVGFQDELVKAVMPCYDVIIIYAGHNEIWSHLYSSSRLHGVDATLPWGAKVDYKSADLRQSMKLMSLKRLFNGGLINSNLTVFEKIRTEIGGRAYDFSLNSRLVYFFKSVFSAFGPAQATNYAGKDDDRRLPFFRPNAFVSDDEKQAILANYASSMEAIENALRPDQSLIISTIIANDLFPPQLDVARDPDLPLAESRAASLYRSVEAGAIDFSNSDVKTLPGEAHKNFLQAVLCMGGAPPARIAEALRKDCLGLALEARARDTLPIRALPGINDFIRSRAGKNANVRVVDPDTLVRSAATEREYLDYFVDFQHPSATAHMKIAGLIIPELPVSETIDLSPTGECDRFVARRPTGNIDIAPDPEIYRIQLQANINWHNNFLKRVSTPAMYAFYKERAEAKVNKCLARP